MAAEAAEAAAAEDAKSDGGKSGTPIFGAAHPQTCTSTKSNAVLH